MLMETLDPVLNSIKYIILPIFQVRQFQKLAKVCPITLLGYPCVPATYQTTVGVWEACCGLALLVGDRELKQGASGILMFIMAVMVASSVALKDYIGIFFPAMHFCFLSFVFAVYSKHKPTVTPALPAEEDEKFKTD